MANTNASGTAPVTQSMAFGPVVVSWTPGTTAGQTTCYVQVQIQGLTIAQNTLSAFNSQLLWNGKTVGQTTSSGNIVMQVGSGTVMNSLTVNTISWSSPDSGEQTASALLGTWANS